MKLTALTLIAVLLQGASAAAISDCPPGSLGCLPVKQNMATETTSAVDLDPTSPDCRGPRARFCNNPPPMPIKRQMALASVPADDKVVIPINPDSLHCGTTMRFCSFPRAAVQDLPRNLSDCGAIDGPAPCTIPKRVVLEYCKTDESCKILQRDIEPRTIDLLANTVKCGTKARFCSVERDVVTAAQKADREKPRIPGGTIMCEKISPSNYLC